MLIRHLPRDSATAALIAPEAQWSPAEHLLASAVDALHTANWQRSGDKSKTRPKPVQRPSRHPRRDRVPFDVLHRKLLEQRERLGGGG